MKIYKLPFMSRVASRLLFLVPDRMYALIMIATLDELDHKMRQVDIHEEDGTRTICDVVDSIKVENWRRNLWKNAVKATLEDR